MGRCANSETTSISRTSLSSNRISTKNPHLHQNLTVLDHLYDSAYKPPMPEIATPETDEATKTTDYLTGEAVVTADFARSLERRLHIARQAMGTMLNTNLTGPQRDRMLENILAEISP